MRNAPNESRRRGTKAGLLAALAALAVAVAAAVMRRQATRPVLGKDRCPRCLLDPAAGLRGGDHSRLPRDLRRRGVGLHHLVRLLRRPAPRGRGRPEADFLDLALEPDMTSLVEEGLVDKNWNANENKGIITDSVVVFSVRPGNPEGIENWEDLVTGDVEIITPNPATSGGAKLEHHGRLRLPDRPGEVRERGAGVRRELFENTSVLDDSARDSLQTFASGKGDVLIGYENEAIQAQDEGVDLEYVIPDDTILIENPVAVPPRPSDPETAQAFLDFIWTDEGAADLCRLRLPPGDRVRAGQQHRQVPDAPGLFTIEELRRLGHGLTTSSSTTKTARSRRSCETRARRSSSRERT